MPVGDGSGTSSEPVIDTASIGSGRRHGASQSSMSMVTTVPFVSVANAKMPRRRLGMFCAVALAWMTPT